MDLNELFFVRKFSTRLYKNLKLKVASADFSSDITETERANRYPVMFSSGDSAEKTEAGVYYFDGEGACTARYISPLYPSAVNEITMKELCGECGFVFEHGSDRVKITLKNADGLSVLFECAGRRESVNINRDFERDMRFSVQVRADFFDVYCTRGGVPEFICTFEADEFKNSNAENFFNTTSVGMYFSGRAVCMGAEVFYDSGIAQADIKPVYYENGEVIFENGRVFFTATLRFHAGGCQGVLSWIPGTAEFELTGVIFFDTGDGEWSNDIASCLVYDRNAEKWLVWMCSFSHGHILGRAVFDGEPRYGRTVIDVKLLDMLPEDSDYTDFGGRTNDEDPAIIYDEIRNRWLLAICRTSPDGRYRYYFFESDNPLDGFECIGSGAAGSETGGTFVRYDGEIYFVCGNGTGGKSDYRVYKYGHFDKAEKLICDRIDGGFRGWGSVFSVKQGSRGRVYWLTFDRENGSEFNWTYGNLYCYEGVIKE